MTLFPQKIYEDFRSQIIQKSRAIDLLILLIEKIDDDSTRKECIEILNKIGVKHNRVFKILENILISDSDENLRYAAAKVIKNKFLNKALTPFLWALQHESSYDCLITIIKSLEEINDDKTDSLLIEEIKIINTDQFKASLTPLITENLLENYSHKILAEILINNLTINSLKKKFNKIKYKLNKGLVIELDFSNIDDQVIHWRYRELLEDCSDILGVKNLNNLKKLKFFPLKWVVNNEFSFNCSLALIKALERLNNEIAQTTLITQIKKFDDKTYNKSIEKLLTPDIYLENLSISKLSDILRNYITISFLKKRRKQFKYKVKNGEIVELYFEGEHLITLSEFIGCFSSLRSLILKDCNLYKLPLSIFSLKYLEILNLEGNNLKKIPKSIRSLRSLKVLNLSKNQLKNIPFSIGALSSLEDLDLENNYLKELPNSIGYLGSLKKLNVSRNQLEEIPQSIGSLKSLQSLKINLNKIKVLPNSIGLLNSLEYLNFDRNNLIYIPDSIGALTSLKTLTLEDNCLTTLPESINLLRSLENLYVGWNKIVNLPNSIGSLPSLKKFYIRNNKLRNLPNSLSLLLSLETLDASLNKLNTLPEPLGKLISLKILKLSDNQFLRFPESICSLTSLEILDLSGNKLESLPNSISSLLSLKEFSLRGNKLKELPDSIGMLASLKKLSLNNNLLASIPKTLKYIA